jgi:glycosyltransferase involved in cell wall biosynthesis
MDNLKLVWSIRSFLDYRVPVFKRLNEITDNGLSVVFPNTRTPERVREKIKEALGINAIELTGETSFGSVIPSNQMANKGWLVTRQPGLAKKIRDLKPDVTIGDGFGQWSVPLLRKRMFGGPPMMMCYERTAHTERHAQWVRRAYRKLALRWIDAACVNGSLSKKYLVNLGMEPEKITTGFMVSEPALGRSAAKLNEGDRARIRKQYNFAGTVFLVVGRLIERKGVLQTLKSWHEFSKSHSDCQLAYAGEGEKLDELKSYCADHQLSNVHFLGNVPYDEIAGLYRASDVMISSTLEDNWSLVVPEAMSCGLPVMNSKYNGCWPELTKDNCTGWVFDPLNQVDFVASLKRCLELRDRYHEIGQSSIELVGQFKADSAAQAILSACRLAYDSGQKIKS